MSDLVASTTTSRSRLAVIDGARGVAILAMIAYHATWDLWYFDAIRVDLLHDPFWLTARTAIISTFLALSGVSLVLATEGGFDRARFLRRLGVLALAAAAVSGASIALFPRSPIFFGVLHHLAVAGVLGLAFTRLPAAVTLGAGIAVFIAGDTLSHPLFDQPWLRWIGLMTFAPDSNDYVPIFPWFGVVLGGIGLGRAWVDQGRPFGGWAPALAPARLLTLAGRHSLVIYLVHQPLLFGAVWLAVWAGTMTEPIAVRRFLGSCEAACIATGAVAPQCERSCRCAVGEMRKDGLLDQVLENRLDQAGSQRVDAALRRCL